VSTSSKMARVKGQSGGLDHDDAMCGGVDDRLVVHRQFVVGEAGAEPGVVQLRLGAVSDNASIVPGNRSQRRPIFELGNGL
jgi:hypothetical protein